MSKIERVVPGYTHLSIEPYIPNIGATIYDIDLSKLDSEPVRDELRNTLA